MKDQQQTPDDPKLLKRNEKNDIITQGPVLSLPDLQTGENPTPQQVIASIFYPGDEALKSFYQQKIEEAYTLPVLQPLMQLMALAGLGKHDAGLDNPKHKHFKIIGMQKGGALFLGNPEANGYYTYKNSAFSLVEGAVSDVAHERVNNWGWVMHEAAHFVMHELFKNQCLPYQENDTASKERMDAIIDEVRGRAKLLLPAYHDHKWNVEWRAVYLATNNVFQSYSPDKYHQELIVKVPELIVRLGGDYGYSWMDHNFPTLTAFYKDHVNPAISRYLQTHKVEAYLALPEPTHPSHPEGHILIEAVKRNNINEVKYILASSVQVPARVICAAYLEAGAIHATDTLAVIETFVGRESGAESKGRILVESMKISNSNALMTMLLRKYGQDIASHYIDTAMLLAESQGAPERMNLLKEHVRKQQELHKPVVDIPPSSPLDAQEIPQLVEDYCRSKEIISKRGKIAKVGKEAETLFKQLPGEEQQHITAESFEAALDNNTTLFQEKFRHLRKYVYPETSCYVGIIKDSKTRKQTIHDILSEARHPPGNKRSR